MLDLGINRTDLARRAGLGRTAVRDILERGATPSIENFRKLAAALNMTVAELYSGVQDATPILNITGISDGVRVLDAPESAKNKTIDIFDPSIVWVKVSDNELYPYFRSGDVIGGPRTISIAVDNLLGLECIVETDDGARHIRTLTRGNKLNRYHLRGLRPDQGEIPDAKVLWAAPIKFIIRE